MLGTVNSKQKSQLGSYNNINKERLKNAPCFNVEVKWSIIVGKIAA